MKIVHIIAGNLDGGAARGAYWLHRGLINLGVDSKVFTNSEITFGDTSVITITKTKKDKLKKVVHENLDYLLTLFYRKRNKDIFSTGFFGENLAKNELVKNADIVHLHWINSGFVNIKHFKKISVPIVWTIRDLWPMTGGCHIAEALDCQNYKDACGNCKQLGSHRALDLSTIVFRRKKKIFNTNIKPVGISKWITQKANESELFKDLNTITIPNNIDTREFAPIDKLLARNLLNISTTKKIILCGATSVQLTYKGFNKYLEALKMLEREKYILAFFGKLDDETIKDLGFEYLNFGYLHDNIALRLLYSAADVFVAPSIMEPFGKTLGEAMACETPVVCFDATGPKDIVDHRKNGYKAKSFDAEDLKMGIKWVLENNQDNYLGKAGRIKVLQEYSIEVIAQKYIEFYQTILDERKVE
ncbi:glycosyltransferase family 4 protein [uncultured Draconibacterium sp.]|uniref:glycosyltransferase family 4 protein n=1 Tax=uncultured Draconibacterium sp. TaxID=1573823 RepID=UPI0032168F8B